jgi:biopolymer transport protein ExbB/TolQ
MQAISDHFYWIIVLLGAIHAAGFVALLQARNRRVRQLESHLTNLVGGLSRRSDHDPSHTVDERIDTFIADIREVIQHPQSAGESRRLYERIVSKDELRRYLQGTKFETWYNVARTGIEIYPLLGIIGTVLAIGLGLNARPDPAPANTPTAITASATVQPGTTAPAAPEPIPAPTAPTGAIVRNFAASIWATLVGLLFAILFMMCNAYLEPSFTRLIEHRANVRNVITHAKSQLGLIVQGGQGGDDAGAARPSSLPEPAVSQGVRD